MRKLLGAALLSLAPTIVTAQDVEPVEPWGSRDFTFRRIAPPPAGQRGTLVQVNPAEEPYRLTPALPPGVRRERPQITGIARQNHGASGWFWSAVSPEVGAGTPRRLDQALLQLRFSDRNITPDTRRMAKLVQDFGGAVTAQARGTVVSPALALAVMTVESAGRSTAVSTAGAQGLMQLMPATAARFGVSDPFDATQNIGGGVAYLNFLLRAFGEDPILAIAAYNAGEGAVAEYRGVPPYAETRDYVPKVLAAWSVARLFCRVPPNAVTEPCHFNTGTEVAENG